MNDYSSYYSTVSQSVIHVSCGLLRPTEIADAQVSVDGPKVEQLATGSQLSEPVQVLQSSLHHLAKRMIIINDDGSSSG